jgi:hypothetical protein
MRHRHPAKGDDEFRAADRDDAIAFEFEFGTDERDLQCASLSGIADQCIGQPMRKRIHRPGDGYTLRLKSPTSEILHRRE